MGARVRNSQTIVVPGPGTMTHFAGWSAASGGNLETRVQALASSVALPRQWQPNTLTLEIPDGAYADANDTAAATTRSGRITHIQAYSAAPNASGAGNEIGSRVAVTWGAAEAT